MTTAGLMLVVPLQISYSTKVHNERNLHAGIPGLVAGICFL